MNARFVTEDGIVVPAVTAERMREIDRIAMEETGPNLFQMMENAGRTLASQTIALLGAGWRGARVVVLAGGGGICAARHLGNRNVSVALVLSEPGRLGEVPTFQRKIFGSTRGHEIDATEVALERPDLIVDALIGYGQAGCGAAFVARPGKTLFPLAPPPNIVGRDLREVADRIIATEGRRQ